MNDQEMLRAILGWDLVFCGEWKGQYRNVWEYECGDVLVARVTKSGVEGVVVSKRYKGGSLFVSLGDPDLNDKVRAKVKEFMLNEC